MSSRIIDIALQARQTEQSKKNINELISKLKEIQKSANIEINLKTIKKEISELNKEIEKIVKSKNELNEKDKVALQMLEMKKAKVEAIKNGWNDIYEKTNKYINTLKSGQPLTDKQIKKIKEMQSNYSKNLQIKQKELQIEKEKRKEEALNLKNDSLRIKNEKAQLELENKKFNLMKKQHEYENKINKVQYNGVELKQQQLYIESKLVKYKGYKGEYIDSLKKYNEQLQKGLLLDKETINNLKLKEIAFLRATNAVNNLTEAITGLAVGRTAINTVKKMIDELVEIDASIYNLGAVSGLSAIETEFLKKDLFSLSTLIPKSATELADAMDLTVRTGQTLEQARKIAIASGKLSVATGEDLKFITETLAKTFVAFELNADSASESIEKMYTSVIKTPLSIKGLSDSMKNSAATFATLINFTKKSGKELDEYKEKLLNMQIAMTARFAELGIQPSKSGTLIRNAITRLITSEQRAMKLFDEAGVRYKGQVLTFEKLSNLIKEDLYEGLNAFTSIMGQLDSQVLKAMFTQRQWTQIVALFSKINGEAEKFVDIYTKSDYLEKAYETQMNSMKNIKQLMENLITSLKSPLYELLNDELNPILVKTISLFKNLADNALARLAVKTTAVVLGINAMSISFKALYLLLKNFGVGKFLLSSTIFNPLVVSASLFAGLATVIYSLYKKAQKEQKAFLEQQKKEEAQIKINKENIKSLANEIDLLSSNIKNLKDVGFDKIFKDVNIELNKTIGLAENLSKIFNSMDNLINFKVETKIPELSLDSVKEYYELSNVYSNLKSKIGKIEGDVENKDLFNYYLEKYKTKKNDELNKIKEELEIANKEAERGMTLYKNLSVVENYKTNFYQTKEMLNAVKYLEVQRKLLYVEKQLTEEKKKHLETRKEALKLLSEELDKRGANLQEAITLIEKSLRQNKLQLSNTLNDAEKIKKALSEYNPTFKDIFSGSLMGNIKGVENADLLKDSNWQQYILSSGAITKKINEYKNILIKTLGEDRENDIKKIIDANVFNADDFAKLINDKSLSDIDKKNLNDFMRLIFLLKELKQSYLDLAKARREEITSKSKESKEKLKESKEKLYELKDYKTEKNFIDELSEYNKRFLNEKEKIKAQLTELNDQRKKLLSGTLSEFTTDKNELNADKLQDRIDKINEQLENIYKKGSVSEKEKQKYEDLIKLRDELIEKGEKYYNILLKEYELQEKLKITVDYYKITNPLPEQDENIVQKIENLRNAVKSYKYEIEELRKWEQKGTLKDGKLVFDNEKDAKAYQMQVDKVKELANATKELIKLEKQRSEQLKELKNSYINTIVNNISTLTSGGTLGIDYDIQSIIKLFTKKNLSPEEKIDGTLSTIGFALKQLQNINNIEAQNRKNVLDYEIQVLELRKSVIFDEKEKLKYQEKIDNLKREQLLADAEYQKQVNTFGNTTSFALSGAGLGGMVAGSLGMTGPLGMAIGAGVGGLIGFVSSLFGNNKIDEQTKIQKKLLEEQIKTRKILEQREQEIERLKNLEELAKAYGSRDAYKNELYDLRKMLEAFRSALSYDEAGLADAENELKKYEELYYELHHNSSGKYKKWNDLSTEEKNLSTEYSKKISYYKAVKKGYEDNIKEDEENIINTTKKIEETQKALNYYRQSFFGAEISYGENGKIISADFIKMATKNRENFIDDVLKKTSTLGNNIASSIFEGYNKVFLDNNEKISSYQKDIEKSIKKISEYGDEISFLFKDKSIARGEGQIALVDELNEILKRVRLINEEEEKMKKNANNFINIWTSDKIKGKISEIKDYLVDGLYDGLKSVFSAETYEEGIKGISDYLFKTLSENKITKVLDDKFSSLVAKLNSSLYDKMGNVALSNAQALISEFRSFGIQAEAYRQQINSLKDVLNYNKEVEYNDVNKNITYETGTSQQIINNYYQTLNVDVGTFFGNNDSAMYELARTLAPVMEQVMAKR